MSAPTTGSLTATGSVTLAKPASDTLVLLQISGTYGTVQFVIEGTVDGTNFVGLGAINNTTDTLVTGTISPADNSAIVYDVACALYTSIRARVTAIASGTAAFQLQSGSFVGLPLKVPAGSGAASIGTAGSTLSILGLIAESSANGITAFAGGGQSSAVALTNEINRVTVVATAADSVKLPAAAAGLDIVIINTGANAVAVFPATGDAINGQSANASVTQMANSVCFYCCPIAGNWFVEGIGGGYVGSLPTVSPANALTALAGGAQAGTAITTAISRFTTVASANDSAQLPVSTPGLQLTIVNAAASNTMAVFPQTGDKINALSANASFAIPANKVATFFVANSGQWHSVLTA